MREANPEVDLHHGGYDSEFVCEVAERFNCQICAKVLREPHLAVCCGQHFCESCLNRWFQQHHSCPHCRAEGKEFSHVIHKGLRSEINQLEVKCNNHGRGCKWTGELGTLKTHLESDKGCGFVEVECPNGCYAESWKTTQKTSMQRNELDRHLKTECYLRQYECEHCGHKDTYCNITGRGLRRPHFVPLWASSNVKKTSPHYDMCPEFPLTCPNKCVTEKIKRKNMDSHRSECPLETVQCPNKCYIDNQTPTSLQRKDIKKHLETECYLRQYQCEHCGHTDKYRNITGRGTVRRQEHCGFPPLYPHYDTCPEFPLTCPNECGAVSIKRKNMYIHHSECPLEPVQCPFAEAGCEKTLHRCQLEDHMTSSIQQHLLLVMNDYKKVKERLRETEAKLQQTETKLDKLTAATETRK